jgi:hypothetical protein
MGKISAGLLATLLLASVATASGFDGAVAAANKAKAAAADPKASIEDVLGLFDGAEAAYRVFFETAPDAARIGDARMAEGEMFYARAEFLKGRIGKDEKLAATHSAAAEEAYRQALASCLSAAQAFQTRAKILTADEQAERKALDWSQRRAGLYRIVGSYSLAVFVRPGSSGREDLLKETENLINDFIWENEDNLLGGYAYLYAGLTQMALDAPDKGFEFLKVAGTAYPVPPRSDADEYTKWTDLYLQGYYKLAEYANRLGRVGDKDYREQALKVLAGLPARVPDFQERNFGLMAMVEQARALKGIGRAQEAKDLVLKVRDWGSQMPEGANDGAAAVFLADQLLAEMLAEGTLRPTPDVLLQGAMTAKQTGDYVGAETFLRQLLELLETEEEIARYAVAAHMEIGECRYRAEDFRGAYEAYDTLLSKYPGGDRSVAGDAAYYRYRAATALDAAEKTEASGKLKVKARRLFVTDYPEHPRALDLRYYLGADGVAQADQLAASGEEDEASKAYAEAALDFLGVSTASPLYAKAQGRLAEVRFKQENYEGVIGVLKELQAELESAQRKTTDPTRLLNRTVGLAVATYYAALAYEKLEKWPEVKALLIDFESRFTDREVKAFHDPVKILRARAAEHLAPK